MNFVATLLAIVGVDQKRTEKAAQVAAPRAAKPRPEFRRDGYYNRFTDGNGNAVAPEVATYREYITATVSQLGTAFFSHHYQIRDERGFWISRPHIDDQHFAMRSEDEAISRVRDLVAGDDRWTHSSEVKSSGTAY
jgi:hypothetical protein